MRRASILIGLLLAVLIAAGTAGWLYLSNWAPSRAEFAVQGIDLSQSSGAVDWRHVHAQDIDFAYVRATEGADGRDTRFAEHWAALQDLRIPHGAIHAFTLCRLASEQAGNFVATVPREQDALPAAIDLRLRDDCPARPDRDVVLRQIRELAAIIETHSGKPTLLRIAPDFEDRYQVSGAIPRPIWATGTYLAPEYLARPWRMWQSNRFRRIEGVEGPVNWNVVAP